MATTETTLAAPIAAVRRFNRFYTHRIGALGDRHLESPFSLTEVRVLYELAHRDAITATELTRELAIDSGYLSRILRGFEARGLIAKTRSALDARQTHLSLSEEGRAAFAPLNATADSNIASLVARIADDDRRKLTEAMRTIERLLDPTADAKRSFVVRTHQPGDIGWVVYRHGVLYAREFGWDERFEALVAQIVAEFIENYDARCERCWIAEQDGERVGSVFLVKKNDTVAKLRLLLVEPTARGMGIGQRLVDECIRFARHARYERITLWTNSVLHSARKIYEAAGFTLAASEEHTSFGKELVGQTWELDLTR